MKNTIRRILWGIKGHPGHDIMVFLVLYGAWAGVMRTNVLSGALFGGLVMSVVMSPGYLWGAYMLGKFKEQNLIRDLEKI